MVTTGGELVEWYQIHSVHIFDAVPLAPFQPLL
jgi:hypothetical protein